MGQVHLVRHGQASFGAEDYDRLSPLGELQSRALGGWIKACRKAPQRVVIGRMRRHRQTAETCLAAALAGQLPELAVDAGLDEFDHLEVLKRYRPDLDGPAAFGRLAREFSPAEAQDVFRAACERWLSGGHDADYRESWPAFRTRCEAALARVLSAGGPSEAWVFTSGGVISAIAQGLLGIADSRALELNSVLVNTGITTLWFRNGRVSLARLNQYAHLESSGSRLTRW